MKKAYHLLLLIVLLLIFAACLSAVTVTVGNGEQQNRKPFDFFYRFSLFETIYYPEEMQTSGYIDAISFYNNFPNSSYTNGHIQVWLGTTNLPDLSSGWIPSGQLTSVFNHYLDFPIGQNVITINLSTPFLYTGGNLVMMARSPGTTTWPVNPLNFYCQTQGATRARDFYSNYTNADHAAPPMTGDYLTLSGQFPKTTFHFIDTPVVNDLGIISLTGPNSMTIGQAYTHIIGIHNYGTGTASQYTVKLYDWNEVLLASETGMAVAADADVQVPIIWIPNSAEGYSSLYAKVFCTDDQNQFNDQSAMMNIIYLPDGGIIDPPGLGTLSGKVTNSQNLPVPEVTVQISAGETVTTNATGAYCFEWLEPGTYQVTVSKSGFLTQTQTVTIIAAQNTNLNFGLHNVSDLIISGRVVRAVNEESGIANATVEIFGLITTAVGTDASGYFRIYDVPANQTYLLRAMHPDYFTYSGDIVLTSENIDLGNLALAWDTTPAADQVAGENTILNACYPNPFKQQTTISFEVKQPVNTSLDIYNIKGQKVTTLTNSLSKAGRYALVWDGNDLQGKPVASGIYYYKLSAGTYTATKKLLLLK